MGCCRKRKKPQGVDKLRSIINGWSNVLWSSDLVKKIAHDRAAVCAQCNRNKHDWCTDCGCWIPAKARSPSEVCDKWKEIDTKYDL